MNMCSVFIMNEYTQRRAYCVNSIRVDNRVLVSVPIHSDDNKMFHRCSLSTAYPHHGTKGNNIHHQDQDASTVPHTFVAMNIQHDMNQITDVSLLLVSLMDSP